jgi:hypothetical protein
MIRIVYPGELMKSFKEWIAEGETLYNTALTEFDELEKQLADLEAKLADKKEEVNQIASVIGKPPISLSGRSETVRVSAAHIVDRDAPSGGSIPASRQTIAKVLAGKPIS